MPNDPVFSKSQPDGEKKLKKSVPLRGGVEQEEGTHAMGEGDRILGVPKEYSGWDVYNNEAKNVDRELVTDWTNSLNFLLLFAALFAAVLTAFIIESKQLLEQDNSSVMLDVMIYYVNNVANITQKPYIPPQFQPQTSDITINCLFFASLSASLVAALASVVALQWVGEYDAAITRGGSSPEHRAKSRHFRHAGVVRWKMGGIIAALPLLLYASVMLFFAGLVLWMWDLNAIVGAVVAGGAAIAVLFYGGSTFLAVAFVSAPFRTPLTRWIYSLYHYPFAALYGFIISICPSWGHVSRPLGTHVPAIISWLEQQHKNHTTSNKRVDRAVGGKHELGRDALIWLAGHLHISQDSYQRLLLLVGELSSLKESHLPTFGPTEASWYSIFDLLGWNYLATTQVESLTAEDKRGMEILQQCYSMPAVRQLTAPTPRMDYISDTERRDYWLQYCGTADDGAWQVSNGPNRLFLLLRDIPMVKEPTAQEIEIAIQVSHWRNLKSKPPQVWDDIFTLAEALPTTSSFFSSCVVTFAQFCQLPTEVVWDNERTEIYTVILRKLIQLAANRPEFPQDATMPMVLAYESLLIGPKKEAPTGSVLTNPLFYGKTIQECSATEITVHESIILLLSRQIASAGSPIERIRRTQEVISLLWLRPSYALQRDWNHLMAHSTRTIPLDDMLVMDWIKEADQIPHIVEILQNLAKAQDNDASIGPLWRATVPEHYNDPHFLEALQMFDNLMGPDCTPADHSRMIDWVCQDLEMEQPPDFRDYFTTERIYAFTQLRDPCLRTLADCARGAEFIRQVDHSSASYDQWEDSWDRIERYLLKMYPDSNSPTILQLQAKLWPMFSFQRDVYDKALNDPAILAYLQRVFQYPVQCNRCLDGPGHLLFHLLDTAVSRELVPQLIPFIETPLDGRTMEIAPIVFSVLYANLPIPREHLFGTAACLEQLGAMLDYIKASEYRLFTLIWNVSMSFERKKVFTEDLAAILAGIHYALRLHPQPESRIFASPLSFSIRRILEATNIEESRPLEERRKVSEAAYITINLLRSSLVPRTVFGGRNSSVLSCARAIGGIQPATGWMAPFQE